MKVTDVIREVKDIAAFISAKSPMVTVPANGARAQIFTPADRQAIERFVPSTRGMTDAETLEAGKAFLETTGEELVRDGGTCQGVQEKDFGPGIGAAVK